MITFVCKYSPCDLLVFCQVCPPVDVMFPSFLRFCENIIKRYIWIIFSLISDQERGKHKDSLINKKQVQTIRGQP